MAGHWAVEDERKLPGRAEEELEEEGERERACRVADAALE